MNEPTPAPAPPTARSTPPPPPSTSTPPHVAAPPTAIDRPRLAVYGGAFDPPTLGHVAAVERLLRAGFDRVLVLPCYGHTFGKKLAPAADRLRLARLAFAQLPEVTVSDFEITRQLSGSTYELVQQLPALPEFATHTFFITIGTDEANQFHRWRRYAELRELIAFVVLPRPGHPLTAAGEWAQQPPHCVLPDDGLLFETSSTAVRTALASGDHTTAAALLTDPVRQDIQHTGLYAPSP